MKTNGPIQYGIYWRKKVYKNSAWTLLGNDSVDGIYDPSDLYSTHTKANIDAARLNRTSAIYEYKVFEAYNGGPLITSVSDTIGV